MIPHHSGQGPRISGLQEGEGACVELRQERQFVSHEYSVRTVVRKSMPLALTCRKVANSAATVLPSFAAAAENSFTTDQVTVASNKSFEQASDAIKQLFAKNGMMVMAEVDQGKMLSMTGLSLKATLYLVGNPTVGKQLFEQNHAVGLYVFRCAR